MLELQVAAQIALLLHSPTQYRLTRSRYTGPFIVTMSSIPHVAQHPHHLFLPGLNTIMFVLDVMLASVMTFMTFMMLPLILFTSNKNLHTRPPNFPHSLKTTVYNHLQRAPSAILLHTPVHEKEAVQVQLQIVAKKPAVTQ